MSEEDSFVFLETSSLPSMLLAPTQKSEIRKVLETAEKKQNQHVENKNKLESKINKLDGTEIENIQQFDGNNKSEAEMPDNCEEKIGNKMPISTEVSLSPNPSMNFLSAKEFVQKQSNFQKNSNEINIENGIDIEPCRPLQPMEANTVLVEKYVNSLIQFTPDATLNTFCEKIQGTDIDSYSSNNNEEIMKLLAERTEMLDILKKNAVTTRQLINSMQEMEEHNAAFKEKQIKENVELNETISKVLEFKHKSLKVGEYLQILHLKLQILDMNNDLEKAHKAEQTCFDYSLDISTKVDKIKELEEIISSLKLSNAKLRDENNKIIEENKDLKESHASIKELFSKACADNVALKTTEKEKNLAFEKYEKNRNEMLLQIEELNSKIKEKTTEIIGGNKKFEGRESTQQIKSNPTELSRIKYPQASTKTAIPISESKLNQKKDTETIFMCPICDQICDNLESLQVHVNFCIEN